MRRTILLFAGVLIYQISLAQNKSIREFQDKYRDFGTYFSLRIDGGILKCLSSFETNNEEAEDFMEMMSEIEAIDIHAIGRKESGFDDDEMQKFKKATVLRFPVWGLCQRFFLAMEGIAAANNSALIF